MVELSYCLGSPTWVAVQDGDRPWTRVLPVAEGRYEPKFRSTRGGVAVVGAGGTGLQVNYGTLAELATIRCDYGYKDVMGTVAGVVYPQGAIVSLGAMITLALRDTVKLSYVADGPQDLFAAARDRNADVSVPARIIIRRDLDPPSNSSIATLDFDSPEAFPSALSAFSVINLGDAPSGGANVFWYGSGAARGEGLRGQLDGANSGRYQAVPLERLAAGDLQSLDVERRGRRSGQSDHPQLLPGTSRPCHFDGAPHQRSDGHDSDRRSGDSTTPAALVAGRIRTPCVRQLVSGRRPGHRRHDVSLPGRHTGDVGHRGS